MRFVSVRGANFRNLARFDLALGPGWNLLVGPNGQGKTNTLEALFFLSALRPLRSVTLKNLIRAGEEAARVEAEVYRSTTALSHRLGAELTATARKFSKDGKQATHRRMAGTVVSIAFTPDDLALSKGSPDGRRKFLDRAVFNTQPAYLQTVLRYQKALKDRNRLLADGAPETMLLPFDDLVAQSGAEMLLARQGYVARTFPRVFEWFEKIAQPAPALGMRYDSEILAQAGDGATAGDVTAQFRASLLASRGRDRARKSTSHGPHRDDLALTMDGAPAKDRASQGQHRALVLALKLAEIEDASQGLGEPPVLLLDDMSSELDAQRTEQLFAAVQSLKGQVILTSTAPIDSVRAVDADATVLSVRAGCIERSA